VTRRRWSIPPVRFAGLIKDQIAAAARALALDLFSAMMVRSPVDTGRFRGNWQIEIAVPAAAALERFDRAGQGTILAETQKLLAYRLGQTITMRNNVPYSVRLEYGYSKQAPTGMVRITIAEAQMRADRISAGMRGRR
jgi:hypothetical protein